MQAIWHKADKMNGKKDIDVFGVGGLSGECGDNIQTLTKFCDWRFPQRDAHKIDLTQTKSLLMNPTM